MVFVIDETGFGYLIKFYMFNWLRTHPLRYYAYSERGKPALHKIKKLDKNLTCVATISKEKTELI